MNLHIHLVCTCRASVGSSCLEFKTCCRKLQGPLCFFLKIRFSTRMGASEKIKYCGPKRTISRICSGKKIGFERIIANFSAIFSVGRGGHSNGEQSYSRYLWPCGNNKRVVLLGILARKIGIRVCSLKILFVFLETVRAGTESCSACHAGKAAGTTMTKC